MTQRHPRLRAHPESVAQWQSVDRTPAEEELAIGCATGAALVSCDSTGAGMPEVD